MSERDSLLAAVAFNPDGDLEKLVLADWLDENGESGAGWRAIVQLRRRPTQMCLYWWTQEGWKRHTQNRWLVLEDELLADEWFAEIHRLEGNRRTGSTLSFLSPIAALTVAAKAFTKLSPEVQDQILTRGVTPCPI